MTEVGREVFGDGFESISRYVDILAGRGREWGIIGPRETDRLWERHVLNSAALQDMIPHGSDVADVGSGAGLPGIPLAILRPDLHIILLEPLLRRSSFLRLAVAELGLADRVTVIRERAEQHHERYDVVVARALAPLDRLVIWCAPLRSADGVILTLKGRSAGEEIVQAASRLRSCGLSATVVSARAHPGCEPATVVRVGTA